MSEKQRILARIQEEKARRMAIEQKQRTVEKYRYKMYVRSCKYGPFDFDYDYSIDDEQEFVSPLQILG